MDAVVLGQWSIDEVNTKKVRPKLRRIGPIGFEQDSLVDEEASVCPPRISAATPCSPQYERWATALLTKKIRSVWPTPNTWLWKVGIMHYRTVNASSIGSQPHSRSISGRNQNIDEAQVVLCWLSGEWAVAGNEKAAKMLCVW
jgi:hypothetical protein